MPELAKAPPAFQFYASDTMADRRYRSMNLNERGLFLSIMCECWVNRSAPSNTQELCKLLGFTKAEIEAALTDKVLSFFKMEKGELINTGLAEYRQRLDDGRANMAKGGRKGANARWRKDVVSNDHPINRPSGVLMGSRVEQSGAEQNRSEPLEKENINTHDSWVKDYDCYEELTDESLVSL